MCGVSFYWSKKSSFSSQLVNSLELTKHRGPDGTGVFETFCHESYLGLGHNRLSILDLSEAGSQPMHGTNGLSLIFNGEIYNHESLRESLVARGVNFNGNSDTEVVLQLYSEFGVEAFNRLEGMFCIVVLDVFNQKLHIVRDAVGIKPIYISHTEKGFFGCSEIKGLRPFLEKNIEIDENDVYEFFNNGFLYEPATGFKGIKKLLPGSILTLDLESGEKSTSHLKDICEYNSKHTFMDKLKNAIGMQLNADVPVGVFFSGGADSSIIASMSEQCDLFFAEFAADESANVDKSYSHMIAQHFGKKIVTHKMDDESASADELMEQVKFVARNTEELISDYTFWPTYQLSIASRESGYKVMLSGMGGDEAFAGYPRYHILANHRFIKFLSPVLNLLFRTNLFPRRLDKKFSRLVAYASEKNWAVAYSRMLGYFNKKELEELFGSKESQYFSVYEKKLNQLLKRYKKRCSSKVKMGQFMDRFGFLPHNLMVSDKASMLASIEMRVPLLNETLVAHGLETKPSNLIDFKETKKPLKKALAHCLPKRLIERPKTGFNPPLDALINKIGRQRLHLELGEVGGFIDKEFGIKLIDEHFSQKQNNSYKIWQLLYFKHWLAIHTES